MSEIKLDGVNYYPAQYCITSVFGTCLSYYGIDLFSDLLGRYWDFQFEYFPAEDFLLGRYPNYNISPVTKPYYRILQEDFGVQFRTLNIGEDKNSLLRACQSQLMLGSPVIASVDPYYFPHYGNYLRYHGLLWNHYVVVYGCSEALQKIYYVDSTRAFVMGARHEMDVEDFYKAVFQKNNIYSLEPELVVMDPPVTNQVQSGIGDWFSCDPGKERQHSSGNGVQISVGTQGLELFIEHLQIVSAIQGTERQQQALERILNQVVLICQHREGNAKYTEKHAHCQDLSISIILRTWQKIKFSLSPARSKDHRQRFCNVADYLKEIVSAEGAIMNEYARTY
ncbi:BtrH N-terminal domain-containing protein [Paenibacillus piscarius]|uniref:BtrH N-terminal domain-containing protein n=1 Tax=Paenibacillus piscarius TaxID=1089681 RepID=UPI001EE95F34|nr:BtrH N-terminal domain-containing protein [Paenibacillus piscarius]